jgi:hypothetical protein
MSIPPLKHNGLEGGVVSVIRLGHDQPHQKSDYVVPANSDTRY